jgi:hypothetical protein
MSKRRGGSSETSLTRENLVGSEGEPTRGSRAAPARYPLFISSTARKRNDPLARDTRRECTRFAGGSPTPRRPLGRSDCSQDISRAALLGLVEALAG